MERLREWLIVRQRVLMENDTVFAGSMDMSVDMWRKHRYGRPLGRVALRGAARRFPEWAPAIHSFLANGGKELPPREDRLTQEDERDPEPVAV